MVLLFEKKHIVWGIFTHLCYAFSLNNIRQFLARDTDFCALWEICFREDGPSISPIYLRKLQSLHKNHQNLAYSFNSSTVNLPFPVKFELRQFEFSRQNLARALCRLWIKIKCQNKKVVKTLGVTICHKFWFYLTEKSEKTVGLDFKEN